MIMAHDKQAMLVNALIKANQDGKLKWEVHEEGAGTVYTEVNEKIIYLSDYHNEGLDSIKVEIYTEGKLADSFLDDDLSTSAVESIFSDSWYMTMTYLLEQSQRMASSADQVLDSLLKDLE